jgi:hypothetical protein
LKDNCSIIDPDYAGLNPRRPPTSCRTRRAQQRLKILGTAQIYEGDSAAKEWIERLRTDEKDDWPERAMVIRVEAFDWNCQQHIPQRFTLEELNEMQSRKSPI